MWWSSSGYSSNNSARFSARAHPSIHPSSSPSDDEIAGFHWGGIPPYFPTGLAREAPIHFFSSSERDLVVWSLPGVSSFDQSPPVQQSLYPVSRKPKPRRLAYCESLHLQIVPRRTLFSKERPGGLRREPTKKGQNKKTQHDTIEAKQKREKKEKKAGCREYYVEAMVKQQVSRKGNSKTRAIMMIKKKTSSEALNSKSAAADKPVNSPMDSQQITTVIQFFPIFLNSGSCFLDHARRARSERLLSL